MTINRDSKAYKQIVQALEQVFLILAGMYFIYRISKSTTFSLRWPHWYESFMLGAMSVVAVARVLATGLLRKESLIAGIFVLVYGMVYRTDGYSFLLFLMLLTVGFMDIDYRRILRTFVLVQGVFFCATMLAGILGVITNFVRIKQGLRSAWGMCYPTDFATMGLFILLALWVSFRKLPDWVMLLICALHGCVAWFIAHSSTSTLCAALFFCAIVYHSLEARYNATHDRPGRLQGGVDALVTVAFPLLALAMFALLLSYHRGMDIGYRVDALLSKRLQYMVNSVKTHGLHPFGTPFVMKGDGFSVFPQRDYTFVDSSYVLILLRYGWVTFLMLCLSWCWTVRKAIRCGDRRLVLIMGIIAVHSFSEHHFIDGYYNVLVTMPLAAYLPLSQMAKARPEGRRVDRREVAAWAITVALFALAAWLAGPTLLNWMKTVLEFKHYGHGEHALRTVCVMIGLVVGAGLGLWALRTVIRSALDRRPPRACRVALAALALCVVAGTGLCLYANRTIDAAVAACAPMVEADRQALETAVAAADGRVCSGVLPAVYARSVSGIDYVAFFEDDLARLRGDTFLMPSNTERGVFFDNGFLYVPVSPEHAIYTGDRAVVEALAAAGYPATGYYSGVQTVNLETASAVNGLAYDPQAGARLAGAAQVLRKGPWQDLYAGKYTSTWSLSLPEGMARGEGKACTLGISINKGEETLLEKDVGFDQFDERGVATITVPFSIQDSRGVGFDAWAEPGCQVDVNEIRFVKTPNYDVHTFYDRKLRRVRDEYYGPDGSRVLRKDGWSACDYEYDRYNNIETVRYYNCDDQPTLIRDGYARKHMSFNAKRLPVREAYYGTDDQPIIGSGGYAAVEREYDAAGNAVVERYYGLNGEPFAIPDGYAQVRRAFNGEGQVIREDYYGVDGERKTLPQGYSGIEQTYDAAGNVASVRYLDGEDRPVMLREGYAGVRRGYDGLHQAVKEAYFDEAGAPVLREGGYASLEREYDDAGNAVVLRFYGLEGESVITDSGYAEVRRDFNARSQVVRERYIGIDGKPVALPDGQYGVEIGYDAVGNQNMRRYLGADGSPSPIEKGYTEVRREFNSRRQKIRETYFDANGQPVALPEGCFGFEQDYDDAGNASTRRYIDAQGGPTVIDKGYAGWQRTYNARRQVVRESYFDVDGAPTLRDKGYAALENVYDDAGRLAMKRYFNLDGSLQREEPADAK